MINRLAPEAEREGLLTAATSLRQLVVGSDLKSAVYNIARGAFSPLEGFMTREDFESVVRRRCLANGLAWTLPITLDVSAEVAETVMVGEELALCDEAGQSFATLNVEDRFTCDRGVVAQHVYGTEEERHPGVRRLHEAGDWLLGGKVTVLHDRREPYPEHNLSPGETRAIFEARGWKTVVAFQTRNVPHAGHEDLQKTVLGLCDGLYIQPVIGRKKPGDFRDDMILKAYDVLIDRYFAKDRVVLGIFPFDMRYAGPREAIFHAIVRKNYGCTHMIVGRDHAGVGNYYHPEAAIEVFEEFPELGLQPICIRGDFFYCKTCERISSDRSCPHGMEDQISFSGTEIRRMVSEGKEPPRQIMRPEVFKVLRSVEDPFVE